MAGKKIAVLSGTTTEARLKATLERRLVSATIVPISNANEGVAMLESGSVDAYAGDKIKLIGLAAQAKTPAKLALLAEDLSIEPYAFALPRNDSAPVSYTHLDVYKRQADAIARRPHGSLRPRVRRGEGQRHQERGEQCVHRQSGSELR